MNSCESYSQETPEQKYFFQLLIQLLLDDAV